MCRSCSRPGIPKGKAPIADAAGRVRIDDSDKFLKIIIIPDDGSEEVIYDKLPKSQRLATIAVDGSERLLADGDQVEVGQQLLEGNVDPHEVLRVMGARQVQLHLVREVQEVYRSQGVSIHDKHIEVIVRQMLRRVTIIDSGSTEFLPGAVIERREFEASNRRVMAEGGEAAAGRPALMGITKASLATESWLSAASFQETTRVLTDAAINAKSDRLIGLKENVIIGKLIPAGTGIARYRDITVNPTEEAGPRRTRCRRSTTPTSVRTRFGPPPVLPCRWTTTTWAATTADPGSFRTGRFPRGKPARSAFPGPPGCCRVTEDQATSAGEFSVVLRLLTGDGVIAGWMPATTTSGRMGPRGGCPRAIAPPKC